MARIERGSLWIVDLGMVAKTRPCLVLSIPIEDTDRALHTVVSHTTQSRGTRYELQIAHKKLGADGVFDVQQLFSVTSAKFLKHIGVLPDNELELIYERVKLLLGLNH